MKWTYHALWRVLLGTFLLCLYSIAFSQTPKTLSAATQQLIDASTAIKAGNRLTADQLTALNEAAKVRQQMLADELSTSHAAVSNVLPKQVRDYLPRETQQYIETEVGPLTGKLEIRAASYEGESQQQSEVIQYVLYVGDKAYYLHFTDEAPTNLETDAMLTINEALKIVGGAYNRHLVLSKKAIINVVNPKYALPLSLGPQRTLTFIVNFSDRPTDRPWTPAQINTLMYTTISNHFMESSYGQTSLTGRVAGWYVLNVSSGSSCNTITNQVSALGDQAATADGIDLNNFDRKVYIFPRNSQCGWAGLGVVGGAKTRSWINGAVSDLRTPAHELGHNFGIYHSRLLICPGSPNSGSCTRSEYGDGTDIMGAARTSHFNAYQKDRLGWLNYQVSPPITTVTTSGTYTIDPFETKNQNPKALKILKRAGGSDYYYLEFRQGIGFDAELGSCGTSCDYTKGVVFHQGNSSNGNTCDLMDMSPSTSNRLVALLPGQSWADPAGPNGGVTFEVVSVASTGAVVKVTFGDNTPPPPPDTKLENNVPVANLSGERGNEKYYYVEVPAGRPTLTVKISGGTGDADLYVRYGERPTTTQWQCRPYTSGNNETCTINAPQAGNYFVMVRAYANYTGVTLVANH
jgi:M6 family metalloprotease-like protein